MRIIRDRFNVPHIYGRTNDDVTFGAGWALAQDRALLLEQARYNARVAAIDAPGLDAIDLIVGLKQFQPERADRARGGEGGAQACEPATAGAGDASCTTSTSSSAGINAYYRESKSSAKPWTRNDVIALNAVKSELFGEGGGDEVQAAEFLDGLQDALGAERGLSVWNDLRQRQDPETPVSVTGNFPYAPLPRSRSGNVVIDNDSFQPIPVPGAAPAPAPRAPCAARRATS